MKYCSECGKELNDLDKFCSACGKPANKLVVTDKPLQKTTDNVSSANERTGLAVDTAEGIGIALTIIGLICGVVIAAFILTKGEIFGYDSWDYTYGGGKEISIWVTIFSVTSTLIGICLLRSSLKYNQE